MKKALGSWSITTRRYLPEATTSCRARRDGDAGGELVAAAAGGGVPFDQPNCLLIPEPPGWLPARQMSRRRPAECMMAARPAPFDVAVRPAQPSPVHHSTSMISHQAGRMSRVTTLALLLQIMHGPSALITHRGHAVASFMVKGPWAFQYLREDSSISAQVTLPPGHGSHGEPQPTRRPPAAERIAARSLL